MLYLWKRNRLTFSIDYLDLDLKSMSTSCNTHDYDGKLRKKWFEMRSMLVHTYLPNCDSFDETIKDIERWLDKKYFNVKRIGRARRSLRILTSSRNSNFDSCNEIDVEELLPIIWNKVKNQEDIQDTFYEQLCDITGGSCSQGRSTRLFQFLFLFDIPPDAVVSASIVDEGKADESIEKKLIEKDLAFETPNIALMAENEKSTEPESTRKDLPSNTPIITSSTKEDKTEKSIEQESIKQDSLPETSNIASTINTEQIKRLIQQESIKLEPVPYENYVVISGEKRQSEEKSKSDEEQSPENVKQSHHNEQLHTDDKAKENQQSVERQQSQ
ncbi:unnamed protein product [Rotaria magnacalcarata]|uniref:Uncharacterized protein n=2 Tax=Rotaria magnacalcarata TaxID=392030 RepID=A0A820A793_9BILA|nr:unnamed protein product [Rotaria magnacalcarata]